MSSFLGKVYTNRRWYPFPGIYSLHNDFEVSIINLTVSLPLKILTYSTEMNKLCIIRLSCLLKLTIELVYILTVVSIIVRLKSCYPRYVVLLYYYLCKSAKKEL